MKMQAIDPAAVQLEELMERGRQFHGHLGPFLVCGLRMGLLALKGLQSSGHYDLQATVETGKTPPVSCLIDGIQLSTGCTLGKGNIRVLDRGQVRATFSKGERELTVGLRPQIRELIEGREDLEAIARKLAGMEDGELFRWELH